MLRWTVCLKDGPTHDWSIAAVPVDLEVYHFGRYSNVNDSDPIDVHVFNTVSLRWRKLSHMTTGRGERPLEVPYKRSGQTAVLVEDIIYIWGGHPYCHRLYGFDVDSHRWFKPEISGPVPVATYDHTACVLGKVMYIYGGRNQLTGCTDDMYKLDTTTMVWSLIYRGTLPPVSEGHSATIIGTKMFVFGRWGGFGYHKVRVFDTETNSWLNTPSAQPLTELRYGHSAGHSAFAYNGELYIYGGRSWNQDFNDLYKFNSETFTWKKVELKGNGPSQRYRTCCCMVGDRIILFGRCKDNRPSDDLYILDLSPTLKTLCKLIVIQYGVEQSELPHNIRWELVAMTKNH